ncbi:hypothetical protein GCM10023257_39150 [Streptomyces hyderabadensis]|uniref:Uncharacterized protein n=1 Tax=Streptomyces hyderabadensis TaxID=598549 RepID=A0ABP9IBL2_9ACTN
MLAVSKAPVPYEALPPESGSSTATDTSAPSGTVTDAMAAASRASSSTTGSAGSTVSTAASPPEGAEDDDDTAPSAPGRAWPCQYTAPVAVAPTTANATRADHTGVRRRGARRARRALEDAMAAIVHAVAVRAVGRRLNPGQMSLRGR